MIRNKIDSLHKFLIKGAYYVIGFVLVTALLGALFNYNNDVLTQITKWVSCLFLIIFFGIGSIKQIYNSNDAIKSNDWIEIFPGRGTTMSFLILNILIFSSTIWFLFFFK